MQASLKALPKGVTGTFMLDLCLWRLKIKRPNAALHRMKNTRQFFHFIVTQRDANSYTLYLVAELHENKWRILQKVSCPLQNRTGCQLAIWAEMTRMVAPLQGKGCVAAYSQLTGVNAQAKQSDLKDALYALFDFEFCLPGENEVISTARVSEIPAYVDATHEPAVVVRPARKPLSKEDWLRQNYPEMSELPKWRFPALVAA
jgi:hypothetical protein